jgi:hypothetical protein
VITLRLDINFSDFAGLSPEVPKSFHLNDSAEAKLLYLEID